MHTAGRVAPERGHDGGRRTFDAAAIRADFPNLSVQVYGKPLVYLDSAATGHRPRAVLDAVMRAESEHNSNIHRGVHRLSVVATEKYEGARGKVRRFINAGHTDEIVFVRGATEAINLVAGSYGRANVGPGDEVLISEMEHHSNIVPWQMLCVEKGATLRVAPIDDRGELIVEELEMLVGPRTRLVAITHVSNALGTLNPVGRIVEIAHARGVPVLIDGAQALPHAPVDVREIGCDFYVFSGHKMFAPSGIGALFGKRELLEAMPPWQGGGDMIKQVTFEKTIYNDLPHKFEAGTPNISGAIGLGAAVDYLDGIGMENIEAYERELLGYGTEALAGIDGLRLIGTARKKAGVLSFVMDGIHPHDIGTVLDRQGVAIRTGHHCAQPVMDRFGVPATSRASLALYNDRNDIDLLVAGLEKVKEMFR